jgi:hypothetical protein
LEHAERLVATWNALQAAHIPMLFAPTIGAPDCHTSLGF